MTKAKPKAAEPKTADDQLAACRPRGDRLVVKLDAARTETPGGIILPDSSAGKRQQTGRVVSVGPGALVNGVRIPIDLSPGDRVLLVGYAGMELGDAVRGDLHVIIRDEDVLAVL